MWNPFNNSGLPFLAQWNTLVCYPLSLIYLVLPLPWSLGIFCLAHLFLGGVGMFCLARRFTNHPFAAAIAGVGFAFSGVTLSSLIWPAITASLAWSPWVLWLVPRAWSEGRRTIILAAAASAMQMLAGGPEILLFTWIALGALFCSSLADGDVLIKLRRCFAQIALFVGLVAVQLFPFTDLLMKSQRDSSFATAQWSMPPWGWANLLVPLFYTDRTPVGVHVQPEQGWLPSYYVGVTFLALAGFAAWFVRNRIAWTLLGLIGAAMVFALGPAGFVYGAVRKALPLLGFVQFPVKWMLLFAVLVPLLAAMGLAHLLRTRDSRTWKSIAFIVLVIVATSSAILGFAKLYPYMPEGDWRGIAHNGIIRLALLCAVIYLLRFVSTSASRTTAVLPQIALLGLLWLDFRTHVPLQNPTVDAHGYTATLPPLKELQPRPEVGQSRAMLSLAAWKKFNTTIVSNTLDNLVGVRLGLYDNCNLLERIPKVDGFYPLYLPHEREVRMRLFRSDTEMHDGLADFLGVSQRTKTGSYWDWESRPSWAPLVTAGQSAVYLDGPRTLNELINPEFNGRRVTFLTAQAASTIGQPLTTNVTARLTHFSSHRLEVDYDSGGHGLVVIAQAYHPNWKARLNGQPLDLLRANHAFQAVVVPPGTGRLLLTYEDFAFKMGVAVSLAALAAALLAWRRFRLESVPERAGQPICT